MIFKKPRFNKEIFLRQKYKQNELLYRVSKAFFSELRFPLNLRFFFFKFYISEYKYSNVRFNNLCLTSSRARSVTRFLRNYRMFSKENISYARWSGIRKSSW